MRDREREKVWKGFLVKKEEEKNYTIFLRTIPATIR